MKKFCFALALMMSAGLVACGDDGEGGGSTPTNDTGNDTDMGDAGTDTDDDSGMEDTGGGEDTTIDVAPGDPIAQLVSDALATPTEPGEQVSAPKAVMAALAPLVERFSDTLLISNLGRQEVEGVERLDFFPVARGRSAVCIGAATIVGATSSLTIRARDLSPGDARRLLAATAAGLS